MGGVQHVTDDILDVYYSLFTLGRDRKLAIDDFYTCIYYYH